MAALNTCSGLGTRRVGEETTAEVGGNLHPTLRQRPRRMGHPSGLGAGGGERTEAKAQCGGLSTALRFGRDVASFGWGENKRQGQSWLGEDLHPTLRQRLRRMGHPRGLGAAGENGKGKGARAVWMRLGENGKGKGARAVWVRLGENGRNAGSLHSASVEMTHLLGG